MNTLVIEHEVIAQAVEFREDAMVVFLDDGRTVSVPLAWYPRLNAGSVDERNNFELIGDGEGIHWPDLDEDISIKGIIEGRRSAESGESLQKWLDVRQSKNSVSS
jgi:hypothetical protein